MSWGERSCIYLGVKDKKCIPKYESCNVSCSYYQWDGKTLPDSEKIELHKQAAEREYNGKPKIKTKAKGLGFNFKGRRI